MKGFLQRILQEITQKKILGASDGWSTIRLSHHPSNPAYYIVNWRISYFNSQCSKCFKDFKSWDHSLYWFESRNIHKELGPIVMTENKWSVWPWKKTTTISIYGLRNGTLHKRHGNKEEGGRRGQNLPIDSMGKVVSETKKKKLQMSFMDVPKGLRPSTWLHPAGPEVLHHASVKDQLRSWSKASFCFKKLKCIRRFVLFKLLLKFGSCILLIND